MNQYSTEPEYSVEKPLERISPISVRSEDTSSKSWDQVVAELRLLSKELSISQDILGRIRESLEQLSQGLEYQE